MKNFMRSIHKTTIARNISSITTAANNHNVKMRTRRQANSAAWEQYRAIGAELKAKQSQLPLTNSDLARLFEAAPHDGDESLWRRQFRTVREISPGRKFARLQEVSICELQVLLPDDGDFSPSVADTSASVAPSAAATTTFSSVVAPSSTPSSPLVGAAEEQRVVVGGNVRVVVKRGKRDWLERARREAAVHRYLTDLQADSDNMPYLCPLLTHYDTTSTSSSAASSYIVTQFITLGPLADAIQSRRVHVNSHRLLHWMNKADEVLRWMHGTARVVHTDAKSDNWLLKNKDDVILFDFDECWREEDFYDPQFFAILKRMDYAKFLFTLDDDLQASGCNHLRRAVRDKSRVLFGGETNPNRAFSTLFAQLGDAVDAWKSRTRQQQRRKQQTKIALQDDKMQIDDDDEELVFSDEDETEARQVIRLPMRGNRIALI